MTQHQTAEELLTPAEVAAMLFVDPKTVTRWARAGKLDAIRTPGGHRRYRSSDVLAIMAGAYSNEAESDSPVPSQGGENPEDAVSPGHRVPPAAAEDGTTEATARALEAEADRATRNLLEAAAAVTVAAERAATAAARARSARAALASNPAPSTGSGSEPGAARRRSTTLQVPSQRGSANQDVHAG